MCNFITMRHLCVSGQCKSQGNAWLISLPFIIPCTTVTTCLFNVSHAHHWKNCVPCPFSPEMKQAGLHQTWWMIICKCKDLNWTRLVSKDSQQNETLTPGFHGHVPEKRTLKENQNMFSCQFKGLNLSATRNGRGCRGWVACAWGQQLTCMALTAQCHPRECQESGADVLEEQSRSQGKTANKCDLVHVSIPAT